MRREIIARRKRQQRIRGILSISTVIVSIVIVFFISGMNTSAHSIHDKQEYKYFTSYELQHGDSLWSIATEYADEHYESIEDYMEEVCVINSITEGSTLVAGTNLIIPYYSEEFK